jgi:hypothetical protein
MYKSAKFEPTCTPSLRSSARLDGDPAVATRFTPRARATYDEVFSTSFCVSMILLKSVPA